MSSKPKRPNSAYICYTIAKRQEVMAANPGLSNTELMSLFGKLWKAETNRAPYEQQAADNKARYAEEMANYVPPAEKADSEAKGKKRKDKDAPKRPKSAYLFFCDVERPAIIKKNPQIKGQEVMKLLGPAWQKLSAKGKAKYEKLAAKDKERYEQELASYVPPKRDASPVRKKPEKQGPKRSKNAFLFFSEAERAKVKAAFPEYKITEISTELGKRWKALSAAERAPFEEKAQIAKAAAQ